MAYQPLGLTGLVPATQQLADTVQQDALLAQQQAADYAAQQQAQTAAYGAMLQDELARQQAQVQQVQAANQALSQAQGAAVQARGGVQPAADPVMDAIYGELNKPEYLRDGETVMSGKQATMWARQNVDKAINNLARRNGWTDSQMNNARAKFQKAHGSLLTQKEAGLLSDVGDLLNDAVEGAVFDLIGNLTTVGTVYGAANLERVWGVKGAQRLAKEYVQDGFARGRELWTGLASDQQKDQEAAVRQANGGVEMAQAIADNPGWILGAAANMAGSGVGGGRLLGWGAKGVMQSRNLLGALRGRVAPAVADDVAQAANTVTARRATAWFDPKSFVAAEGSGAAVDVLSQPGAFDEATGQYTPDALVAGGAAGVAAGGITALGMRFGTAESVLAGLGKQGVGTGIRGDLTGEALEQAAPRVASMLGANATNQATKEALQQAGTAATNGSLTTLLSRTANTESRKAALAGLMTGTAARTGASFLTTAARSAAVEGSEEALIALVSATAALGIGEDGKWSLNNIDTEALWNAVSEAGVAGAALGTALSPLKMINEHRQDQATIAAYEDRKQQELAAAVGQAAAPQPAEPVAPLATPAPAEPVYDFAVGTGAAVPPLGDAFTPAADTGVFGYRYAGQADPLARMGVYDGTVAAAPAPAPAPVPVPADPLLALPAPNAPGLPSPDTVTAPVVQPVPDVLYMQPRPAAINELPTDPARIGTTDTAALPLARDTRLLELLDTYGVSTQTIAAVAERMRLDAVEAQLAADPAPDPEVVEAVAREKEKQRLADDDVADDLTAAGVPADITAALVQAAAAPATLEAAPSAPAADPLATPSQPATPTPAAPAAGAFRTKANAGYVSNIAKTFSLPKTAPEYVVLEQLTPKERRVLAEMLAVLDEAGGIDNVFVQPNVQAALAVAHPQGITDAERETYKNLLRGVLGGQNRNAGTETAGKKSQRAKAKAKMAREIVANDLPPTRLQDDPAEATRRAQEAIDRDTKLTNALLAAARKGPSTVDDFSIPLDDLSVVGEEGDFGAWDLDDVRYDRGTTTYERSNAVLAVAEAHYRQGIRTVLGDDVLQRVVFVHPALAPNPQAQGFTVDNDPERRIFITLHAARPVQEVVHTVAHELLHLGMTVRVGGRVAATADEYNALMDAFMEHAYVRELMSAMAPSYPGLSSRELAEEALAELNAVRMTKRWDSLTDRWGVRTVPTSLRASLSSNPLYRLLSWFKGLIRALRLPGTRQTVTDRDVAAFLRSSTEMVRRSPQGIVTPADAQAFALANSFTATQQRADYYHAIARQHDPYLTERSRDVQAQTLTALAADDPLALRELRFDAAPYRGNEELMPPPKWKLASVDADARRKDDDRLKAAADAVSARGARDALMAVAQAVHLYKTRRGSTAATDPSTEYPVGIIAYIGDEGVVRVRIRDTVRGDVRKDFEPQFIDGVLRPEAAFNAAREWVYQQFGDDYDMRTGSAVDLSLYLRDYRLDNTAPPLTIPDTHVLTRAAYMEMDMPGVRRIAQHLARYLPDSWIPVLDKVLDFLYAMRVHWVDVYSAGRDFVKAYNAATGITTNTIEQMLSDVNAADAWLARTTDQYEQGTGFNKNWERMSFRDGWESVFEMMAQSGLSSKQIHRDLYAVEELVRRNWREHTAGGKGEAALQDPTSLGERARFSETGFRYADWDTVDMTKGTHDHGARRWLQDFMSRPQEEQDALGRIVAAIAAVNRAVIQQEQHHQVLGKDTAEVWMKRGNIVSEGQMTLNQLFANLHEQGMNLDGFFLTMRDADSNPYKTATAEGRTSLVKDAINTTQTVLRARVRRAFANKELAVLVRQVLEVPNKHFIVSPAVARFNEDGEREWYTSDKNAKASVSVIVEGHPVMLVATSDAAAKMLRQPRPHEAVQKLGMVNHLFNAFKTTYNLAYLPVGLTRDLLTGYMNISGAIGEKYVPATDAPKVGMAALKYAIAGMPEVARATATGSPTTDPYFAVFQEKGAGMFFGDAFNAGAMREDTVSRISHNPLVQRGWNVVKSVGYTPETAMRLGAFRAYMEYLFPHLQGGNVTVAQLKRVMDDPKNRTRIAAVIQATKHITSNFQQHGADNTVRYLFSFHNAVMQGTFDTLPRILATEHGRKTLGMLMAATVIAAVYGISSEDEDEFGNSKYFHTVNRHRSLVLGDVAIPVSDEAAIFRTIIENGVGIVMGKRNLVDAAMDVASTGTEMVTANPIGNTGDFAVDMMYGAMPTLTHGFIGLATGKDVFGNPLKRDAVYDNNGQRISNPADVELTTGRASVAGNSLAQFLYGSTGGGIDMSGDEVDFFLRSYLGGVYAAFARSSTAAWREQDGVSVSDAAMSVASEPVRGFRAVQIDRTADRAWERLKERVGTSMRHAGGRLDVMNAADDPAIEEAAALIKRTDAEQKAVVSPNGRTVKQIYDAIEQAEAAEQWADVRDLRLELQEVYAERDRIRADAIREAIVLGVM